MKLLLKIQDMLNSAKERVETKNFYFETHKCPVSGEYENVRLDYVLKIDQDKKIVKFGSCQHCKTLFYHEDYELKSF